MALASPTGSGSDIGGVQRPAGVRAAEGCAGAAGGASAGCTMPASPLLPVASTDRLRRSRAATWATCGPTRVLGRPLPPALFSGTVLLSAPAGSTVPAADGEGDGPSWRTTVCSGGGGRLRVWAAEGAPGGAAGSSSASAPTDAGGGGAGAVVGVGDTGGVSIPGGCRAANCATGSNVGSVPLEEGPAGVGAGGGCGSATNSDGLGCGICRDGDPESESESEYSITTSSGALAGCRPSLPYAAGAALAWGGRSAIAGLLREGTPSPSQRAISPLPPRELRSNNAVRSSSRVEMGWKIDGYKS